MEAGFMEGARGGIFYVLHPPVGLLRGAVLYAHPFAEEMNKSRRMAALQARLLAAHGFAVLMPDHYGCGDSAGDFGEATWDGWIDDLAAAAELLHSRYNAPLTLWGLRTGCLLLSELLARGIAPERCLFWQPVTSGELYLNQFLRLRTASEMMAGGKESVKALREALARGETLEVAGYMLSPALAQPLAGARLAPPACPAHWMEVVMDEGAELPPASCRVVDAWRAEGASVSVSTVPGEPFWNTQEIREVPALLDASLKCLLEAD
ncbi:hydrolase 2, exosortase A system-associated [Thioalkalivibrio denitrificans]|uniref:Hydrolase 2, exosortase A system-associated n=1 Tax=Thioalkalivibrio denitrificans TaxID=108003 RepID=A0A1V3ND09_9GAMM|nr:hydrolase 2, exosortase A system-associated [Thioalkalivibrio denitrificans]OOG22752.1 hydrolase 2, exosortase A system-associated [Thioalkalivibrio denitrificans]